MGDSAHSVRNPARRLHNLVRGIPNPAQRIHGPTRGVRNPAHGIHGSTRGVCNPTYRFHNPRVASATPYAAFATPREASATPCATFATPRAAFAPLREASDPARDIPSATPGARRVGRHAGRQLACLAVGQCRLAGAAAATSASHPQPSP